MFWKKKKETEGEGVKPKLPRPKDLPQLVGKNLVVELDKDPDWVWNLKSLLRPRPESKKAFDFRVYDPVETDNKRISVKDYHSLDEHPEMILFEGWFDQGLMTIHLQEKQAPAPRAA